MIAFFQKYHRPVFYLTWFFLSLFQASFTQLIDDESYYWVYSRFLSWGYFDHPPMIALLIKWGYAFFQNEFGVRLFCILLNTLTIFIIENLLEKKSSFLFYSIVLSIGIFQIGGFLAVPDTPLLFFTALFFYCYRKFVQAVDWKNALLLGLVTALLFYSKYHGVLVVFFTILSNIKLLSRWQTWLAGFSMLIFFAPHLLWQWDYNWISFRYHLFESNISDYKFSYTTDYILGQLLLAGPLAGLVLLPAAFLYKPRTSMEKAMKFSMIGIYVLFFLSSLRGKVEPNWTLPVLVPLVVLSHQFIIEKISWLKPLRIILPITLLLVAAGRIYLVVDIGPDNAVKKRFHYNKEWTKIISDKTGTEPVVFFNSYQRASRFWFYSGKPSHSLNDYKNRRNNYNLWPTENQLLGKPVYLSHIYDMNDYTDSIKTMKGWTGWRYDSLFSALGKIEITYEKKKFILEKGLKSLQLKCRSNISRQYLFFLREHPELKAELIAAVFNKKGWLKDYTTGLAIQQLSEKTEFDITFDLHDLPAGKYTLMFAIQSEKYPPTHNSEKIEIIIR